LININKKILGLFAKLYDQPGTSSLQAKLPPLHSIKLEDVLKKINSSEKTLGDLTSEEIYATPHWDETSAQKDKTIKRDTGFPSQPEELVLSLTHFFV
jgi:hypothetical protein